MACEPSKQRGAAAQLDIAYSEDSTVAIVEKEYAVYVASGDSKDGVGIGVYKWSPKKATMEMLSMDSTYGSTSYLALDAENLKLYGVGDKLSTFEIDAKSGELSIVNKVENTGKGACHISISNNKKFITVAYYSSGSAATFALDQDGSVRNEVSNVQHEGSSIDQDRQKSPHVHMAATAPNSDLILLPDLGIDQVKIYKASERGELTPAPNPYITIDAGGGPRHLAFSPDAKRVYILHELTGHVTGFGFDPVKGISERINTISTLPIEFEGSNKSADIHVHPNGKYLYASNRGHNSIAIFSIAEDTGALTFLGARSCGGDWPRAFAIDPTGDFLLVANQKSNQISILKIDQSTGFFEKVGEVATVLAPQCIRFVELSI